MNNFRIGFIGAGNMAGSLIGGLINTGFPSSRILACDPSQDQLSNLQASIPEKLELSTNNARVSDADVVVLAVKPQIMARAAEQIKPYLKQNTLVISVAAGISVKSLQNWLGELPVVRCMPNTPALIGLGASGLFASEQVSDAQKELSQSLLSAVGTAHWVESENLIDVVTAVSGSGPAYFFLFAELMAKTGEDMGLDPDTARALSLQTFHGAAQLACQSEHSLTQLRKNVTSPGGTTQAAIEQFQADRLESVIANAMRSCAKRAGAMSEEFGSEELGAA